MKGKYLRVIAPVMLSALVLGACGNTAKEETAASASAAAESASSEEAESASSEEAESASASETVDPTSLEADLYLYTSEPEELVSDMVNRFHEIYPGIDIEINRAGTGKITAQLDTELQTGSTDANILWFADIGYMKDLDEKGMVEHYVSPNSATVDPQYLYDDGLGGEVRLIYNIIAYNTGKITEAPKDWGDVVGGDYANSFAVADPNISGGSATALVVQVQNEDLVGWGWYDDLAANGLKYETANGELQTKVASGEYAGVEIVDFMARTAREEGSPVDVCYPESGAILVPTPITLLNNMDDAQMAAAKAFVDWCYTEEAQELMVGQQYIPVLPGVEGPANCPTAEEITTMPFDLQFYLDNKAAILDEFTSRFGGAEQ